MAVPAKNHDKRNGTAADGTITKAAVAAKGDAAVVAADARIVAGMTTGPEAAAAVVGAETAEEAPAARAEAIDADTGADATTDSMIESGDRWRKRRPKAFPSPWSRIPMPQPPWRDTSAPPAGPTPWPISPAWS